MHTRVQTWFVPDLTAGMLTLDASDDGWLRLRISIDGPVRDRRSWALDPATAAGRRWAPVSVPEPVIEPAAAAVRFRAVGGGDVEGTINPESDSRGLIEERVARARLGLTGTKLAALMPAIAIARSRDGIRVDLPLAGDRRVYGLGERTGGLDKRGRTWTFWNTDEPLHTANRDPLYQSIPVAYLFAPGETVTVFSDSPATQYIDVGESDPEAIHLEVYDTQVDLYLRVDPTLPAAVTAYTGLTGRMPLPPEWAIGYQQSRYSYYPEARVLEIARKTRELRVPCDVIYLDIHYMDGYRVFTWNPDRFPDPARMIARLRDEGFHVVTIVDPGVKVDADYEVFAGGRDARLYLERATGEPYVGKVWPGDAVYPDFSDERTREWWAARHAPLLEAGVDGIWNDMNEPADFTGDPDFRPNFTVPDDLVARNDGDPVSFGRVHNAYASGMCRGTRAAFRAHRPEERGFILTRAGYAGIQRDAAVWTGDNHSWWEHIAVMTPMQLNLGLSGVPFVGADTGGFQQNATGELFARWIAASCLMPFFRTHTALDTIDQEPWSFGDEVLAASRRAIELRYQLLPYIYTLFEEATGTGVPIIRPLVWEFPEDPNVADRADSFLLGPHLLVAPVRERGVAERSVYLPAGGWYDLWTGESFSGPATVIAAAPLGHLPLYVRAGSVIPYEAVRQSTSEPGDGVLRFLVAPGVARESDFHTASRAATAGAVASAGDGDPGAAAGFAVGNVYADRGEGFEYRTGSFWRAVVDASVPIATNSEVARVASGGSDSSGVSVRTVEGVGLEVTRWTRIVAHRVGSGLPVSGGVEVSLRES